MKVRLCPCCELTLVVYGNHSITSQQQCCNDLGLDVNLLGFSATFATCLRHLQHVYNSLCKWKCLYVKCETVLQPLRHVHSKHMTDSQQKYHNTPNNARIPATTSQQQYRKPTTFTTGLRLLYHNIFTTRGG